MISLFHTLILYMRGEAGISDPLIHSQWACGRKALPGEDFAAVAGWEKPVLRPVLAGWGESDKKVR